EDVLHLRYAIQWRRGAAADLHDEPASKACLSDGDQIWIPELRVSDSGDSEAFAVGAVIIRIENDRPILVFYSIRKQFRKMRLLESTMASLAQKFAPRVIQVQLTKEDVRFHEFFRRKGFEVTPVTTVRTRAALKSAAAGRG